jgi:hypothetical protein
MAAPRKKKAAPRATGAREERKYEAIQFAASGGTRALYRKAAELEGLSVNEWMRTALFERAVGALEEHGVEYPLPPVHPERPKPLPLRRR